MVFFAHCISQIGPMGFIRYIVFKSLSHVPYLMLYDFYSFETCLVSVEISKLVISIQADLQPVLSSLYYLLVSLYVY